MSSTSEEEDNDGIDVETLENGDYDDIRTQEEQEINISPKKNKNKKKVKTPPKKKNKAPQKDRKGAGGRGVKRFVKRDASDYISPSKRRRASELAYDIASHGYYQKDDYYFYNDAEDDDSVCGDEAPWDEDDQDPYADPWSDREDWPDTPSEDNYSSDEGQDDRTVCILTDESPGKVMQSSYRSPVWDHRNPVRAGAGGRGQQKPPLYNIVVETNATPKKNIVKSTAKSVNVEAITQRVNRTISFNMSSAGVKSSVMNVVPTISLKPRVSLRPVLPANPATKTVYATSRSVSNMRQIHLVPARPPAVRPVQVQNSLALNTILEQQAAQRQKLQTYKIPLVSGSRAAPRTTLPRQQRPVLPQGQTFQIAGLPKSGTTATIIPLSQLGATTLNLMPLSRGTTQPVRKVFTIGNPTGVVTQRKTAPPVVVPMSAFNTPRQAYFIQHSKSGQPIHIVTTSSSASVAPRFPAPGKQQNLGKVLRTNTGSNVQALTSTKVTSKTVPLQPKINIAPLNLAPKPEIVKMQQKKPEIERGIFDIVNSVEFMAPPLQDPDNSSEISKSKGSLFDSLEQEFMGGDTFDLTRNSGDEDDMITLDLEPVSPSDPQLFNPNDTYENEEERNVFESFQSLLEQ